MFISNRMKTWPSSHLILTTPDEEKPANSTLYISMSTVSNTQIPHVVNTFHVSPSLACNQRYRPQTAASQAQYTTCMEHQHNMSLHLRSSLIFGGFDEWLVSQVNSVSGPTGRAGGCVGFVRGRVTGFRRRPGLSNRRLWPLSLDRRQQLGGFALLRWQS